MSVKLGILLPKTKKKKIRIPERIETLCADKGIVITEVDVDSLDKQGPFDVFLHKITDFYNECSKDETELKMTQVKEFVKRYPKMCIIDDFEAGEMMTDRKHQTKILHSCEMTMESITVFVPKIIEISSNTQDSLKTMIEKNNMKFPVLAKPIAASLQDDSHKMTLIFSEENLNDLPVPCLLQEFCNHGGVVYKVFVVGDRFNMCERPSIKNIFTSTNKTLIFDTRNVSKTGKAFIPDLHESDPNLRTWLSCDDNPDMLNRKVIGEVCKRLRDVTGLFLFGFDILVESGTGNYGLIDVNHFPGYTGINPEHFSKNLVDLIFKQGTKT